MALAPSSQSEGVRAGSALSCSLCREFQGTHLAEEWLAVRMVTPPCNIVVDVHKSLYLCAFKLWLLGVLPYAWLLTAMLRTAPLLGCTTR